MTKRIVLATDAWHPQINGAVTVLARLASDLRSQGYEVLVIHPGLFVTVPLPGYAEIPLALFPYRKIRRMLAEGTPSAVHIATEGPVGFATRRACVRGGIPFTTSYHTHFHLYLEARMRGLTRVAYAYLRWFHQRAVRTMVATATLQSELEAEGFTNVVLWPLGVDTELFKRNEAPALPALAGPVFAYLGRVAPEKNIEAFLSLSLPGTKLVIGDGPDRARLEARYSDVRFVGYKSGQEIVDHLSQADVLVFPSKTETFGLVVIEAMALSIPVAAYPVMGPKDIITDGVDGALGDDLRAAALRCLTLDRSKCRAKALQYSWENSVKAFVSQAAWR